MHSKVRLASVHSWPSPVSFDIGPKANDGDPPTRSTLGCRQSGVSQLTKQSQLPVGVWADLPSNQALKNALAALRTGPICFRRNQVIACEGDIADYVFFVVSGVVRSCRTFLNGERSVVAFYLPGDLFGWDNETRPFSIEAASDAMVTLIRRRGLSALAEGSP